MLFEDLPIIEWKGVKFAVLDKLKEGERNCLGLATVEALQHFADAMNEGAPILFPSALIWVEETSEGYVALSAEWQKRLQGLKAERAAKAFRTS